jgi:uncharacterized membrane protein
MTMWPDLMGSGWGQQLLMSIGILCVLIAAFKALAVIADRQLGEEGADPFLALWHRYEEGDLTRQEFQRLSRSLRQSLSAREVESKSPGPLSRVLPERSSSILR